MKTSQRSLRIEELAARKKNQKIRTRIAGTLIFLWLIGIQTGMGQTGDVLRFFPGIPALRPFVADGMAHRFSVAKLMDSKRVNAAVGTVIPVIESAYLGVPM